MEIALDQCGTANERRLALIDKNRDLYLTQVRVYGAARKTCKLGKVVCENFCLSTVSCTQIVLFFKYRFKVVMDP